MAFCGKCGAQVNEGVKFCPSCGASTEIPKEEPTQQTGQQTDFSAKIAYGIAYAILSSVILAISWRLYFLVSIIWLVSRVFLVLLIIGIMNAANGRAKELPIIGKFKILK